MNLLERVENEKPHFAEEKLKVLDDRQFKRIERFSKSDYWCSGTGVNVHDVTGTIHPDYAGNTWLNLLQYGKRMKINLKLLEENPGYYRETADHRAAFIKYFSLNELLDLIAESQNLFKRFTGKFKKLWRK